MEESLSFSCWHILSITMGDTNVREMIGMITTCKVSFPYAVLTEFISVEYGTEVICDTKRKIGIIPRQAILWSRMIRQIN